MALGGARGSDRGDGRGRKRGKGRGVGEVVEEEKLLVLDRSQTNYRDFIRKKNSFLVGPFAKQVRISHVTNFNVFSPQQCQPGFRSVTITEPWMG